MSPTRPCTSAAPPSTHACSSTLVGLTVCQHHSSATRGHPLRPFRHQLIHRRPRLPRLRPSHPRRQERSSARQKTGEIAAARGRQTSTGRAALNMAPLATPMSTAYQRTTGWMDAPNAAKTLTAAACSCVRVCRAMRRPQNALASPRSMSYSLSPGSGARSASTRETRWAPHCDPCPTDTANPRRTRAYTIASPTTVHLPHP